MLFFSDKVCDEYSDAPFRLTKYMSRKRFNQVLSAMRYTDKDPPSYKDRFFEVRQMLDAWNYNMTDVFEAGWATCLDESMSPWTNKYTCPGFVWIPRKPWPYGNEYHTICCCTSGILFAQELVEGRDRPKEKRKNFLSSREQLLDYCCVSARVSSTWPRSSFSTVASVS